IICKNKNSRQVLSGVRDLEYGVEGAFDFNRCPGCGVLALSPMPSLEDLKSYYPEDYHGFHTSGSGIISFLYRLVYVLRFREYERLVGKTGQLLDVGCADAPYFDLLKKQYPGMNLSGVEFKDEIAAKGREKGRRIITGTIMDLDAEEQYDLIIMNNLIEHVIDPLKELEKAYLLLKPGGYVILETPNTDSWDYYLAKKHWGGLHAPRHTYLFSYPSINRLVSRAGFELVKRNYPLN
ncbi:MAG: class I SAM-dependent methyltransferase, partial [bacterium]|nr:class I SAM-dependent methyltransferase [bacterium]